MKSYYYLEWCYWSVQNHLTFRRLTNIDIGCLVCHQQFCLWCHVYVIPRLLIKWINRHKRMQRFLSLSFQCLLVNFVGHESDQLLYFWFICPQKNGALYMRQLIVNRPKLYTMFCKNKNGCKIGNKKCYLNTLYYIIFHHTIKHHHIAVRIYFISRQYISLSYWYCFVLPHNYAEYIT